MSLLPEELAAVRLHASVWAALSDRPPRIYDVGAHEGEVTLAYLKAIPNAAVTMFEPNPALQRSLTNIPARLERCALGSKAGPLRFHVNRDDSTSSVLPTDFSLEDRSSAYITTKVIEVNGRSLNDFEACDIQKNDCQGYDLEVLRGGTEVLPSISIVSCEVMFATAYQGQALFHEIASFLERYDFRFHSFTRLVKTPAGCLYFGDATWLSARAWNDLGFL